MNSFNSFTPKFVSKIHFSLIRRIRALPFLFVKFFHATCRDSDASGERRGEAEMGRGRFYVQRRRRSAGPGPGALQRPPRRQNARAFQQRNPSKVRVLHFEHVSKSNVSLQKPQRVVSICVRFMNFSDSRSQPRELSADLKSNCRLNDQM